MTVVFVINNKFMEDINKELAAIWEEYASIDNEVLKERGYL